MPAIYRSRHGRFRGSSPPSTKYSVEAWTEFSKTSLERNEEDEARLELLNKRRRLGKDWTQDDEESFEEIMSRKEDRSETKRAPLRRDLEGCFVQLGLDPLPPPLEKSSHWLDTRRPGDYQNSELRPFLVACEEGSLDVVRQGVSAGSLRHISFQDGLACAARGNQLDVARYLLEEGARPHAAVIVAACRALSLPLFELSARYGYHPNQQVPSPDGRFRVALNHCLGSESVTRFLLENGADPDLAPFADNRTADWGYRAAPPMDRTSGLALDRAVDKRSFGVVKMLLEHGANPAYAHPLQRVIHLHRDHLAADTEQAYTDGHTKEDDAQWRQLIDMLLLYGTDINAVTYGGGTALTSAVAQKMWDVAEFLLERGADPRIKKPVLNLDAFAIAAKDAGTVWDAMRVSEYVSYLCESGDRTSYDTDVPPAAPEGVRENPLVPIVEGVKRRRKNVSKE
ncbi:cnpv019 ankyrin repeat protein [Colletotrichum truncatum]|uniref:Cnpv019 ankyrin repeat protein n=1 Tax=Colletotrichum truncatum TaxID=5467 RepID=A0ACC3ZGZ6_COLTU|nr:cnpv019 ankyrin repeat protein [Colletotrichum truncatum]KAF6790522.1 cnpv019 ankyrin repeat protein [Colletotrichum truncatum]